MTPPSPGDFESVIQRLAVLEAQNRSLKRAFSVAVVFGGVLTGILFAMILASRNPPIDAPTFQRMLSQVPSIEAPRFVLRDTSGNSRAVWSVSEKSNTSLIFLAKDGAELAGIS